MNSTIISAPLSRVVAPKGFLPIKIGEWEALIWGGPYMLKPPGFYGVKMAKEIDRPCDINIPTVDFSVPDPALFRKGLIQVLPLIAHKKLIYVGCMGGIGRTGLFLGGVAKIMAESLRIRRKKTFNPREYVRAHYYSHAIETKEQEQYLADLDVRDLAEWSLVFQRVPRIKS